MQGIEPPSISSFQSLKANVQAQNGKYYIGGYVAGQVGTYAAASEVVKGLPFVGKAIGNAAERLSHLPILNHIGAGHLQNILGGLAVDVVVDTTPETVDGFLEGESVKDIAANTSLNVLENLGWNIVGEGVITGLGKAAEYVGGKWALKGVEGGSGTEGSQNVFNQMSPEDQKRFLAWEQARIHGITPDNPDVHARFGFLLDNGVDYDNAYFMATLNRNIYESFNEDEIVKLINNVEEFSSTLSNNKRYPAVAGVYNKHTGEFIYGTNLKTPNVPQLAPQLEEYFNNMPSDVLRSYNGMSVGAGTHAEIIALNNALKNDPSASIDDFLIYVMHGNKADYGMPFVRCPHCQWITQEFYSVYK